MGTLKEETLLTLEILTAVGFACLPDSTTSQAAMNNRSITDTPITRLAFISRT